MDSPLHDGAKRQFEDSLHSIGRFQKIDCRKSSDSQKSFRIATHISVDGLEDATLA